MVKQLPSEYDFDNRIIEPDGSFDEDSVQELELGEEKLLSMYENMVRARSLDSRGMTLQRQGRIANWVPCSGQEGIHVGAATALGEDDWLSTYGRQHGAQLARGRPMKDIYLYWGGSEWGNVPPQGLNHLPVTIPIGTHIPHGVGVGWASKLKGNDEVSLIHFGDGATSEGDFHEGMNFAGVFEVPVVFVCENNQYAISVPREKQTASETLAQKAHAYGFKGVQVDGNDVLAVYREVKNAVERARGKHEPTLIEAVTYRQGPHTTSDDPTVYRDEEEEKEWEELDPIKRYESFLKRIGLWDEDYAERVNEEAEKEAKEAAQDAVEELELDPQEMFEYTYSEPTSNLEEQRRALKESMEQEKDEE